MSETEYCSKCDKDVMPIDGDCPICGNDPKMNYLHGSKTVTYVYEDGEEQEAIETDFSDLSLSKWKSSMGDTVFPEDSKRGHSWGGSLTIKWTQEKSDDDE